MRSYTLSLAALSLILLLAPKTPAATLTLGAKKDNTIYEEGSLSNGAGDFLFAGTTGATADFERRRALIAFDIAGALPSEAVITGVTLTLHLSKSRFNAPTTATSLFPLLADWGEGISKAAGPEGSGAPATVGDATWNQRFFGGANTNWTTPGGDIRAQASATTAVGSAPDETPVRYTWSGARMVADVQSWMDNPDSNFGWLVISDETATQAAKRFNSRSNPNASTRPALTITYEVIPEPTTAGLLGIGALILMRRRRGMH